MFDPPKTQGVLLAQTLATALALQGVMAEMLKGMPEETRAAVKSKLVKEAFSTDDSEAGEMQRAAARSVMGALFGISLPPIPPDA